MMMRTCLVLAVLAVAFSVAEEAMASYEGQELLAKLDDASPFEDSAKPVSVGEEEIEKVGQFGGSFGGALLTSGSFTMMAASGGFEEEEVDVGEANTMAKLGSPASPRRRRTVADRKSVV